MKLIQFTNPHPLDHVSRGLQLMARHEYQGAIGEFEQALVLDLNNADLHSNLGIAYWKKAAQERGPSLDDAIREFQIGLKFQPANAALHDNLGLALLLLGGIQ